MDLIEKLRRFKFDDIDLNQLTEDELNFYKGIDLFIKGDLDSSESILLKLHLESNKKEIKDNATKILFQILYWQNKWSEIKRLNLDKNLLIDEDYRSISIRYEKLNQNYNFLSDFASIPMKLSSSGSPTIDVKINGIYKTFWFDTGALISIISEETAELCNIKMEDDLTVKVKASTGKCTESRMCTVPSLEFGNFKVYDQIMIIIATENLILKHPKTNEIVKIDGIIGWDLIKDMNVIIDYKNEKIEIRKPKKLSCEDRNMFCSAYPIIKILNDENKPIYFGLDTGANKCSLGETFSINKENIKFQTSFIGGVGGYKEKEVKTVGNLKIRIKNEEFVLKDRNISMDLETVGEFFIMDGIIGSDIIKDGKMIIDYTNKMFSVERQ